MTIGCWWQNGDGFLGEGIYEVEKQKRKGEGGEKVVLSNLRY